jgi:rfaE bifunctional protein kinase chain/domain
MSTTHMVNQLLRTIDRLSGATVGVVGDLVADLYVSGLTDRVSREAPVLIVQYEEEWLRPGGAANVAANITALGANACVVGLIGEDEVGRRLIASLQDESSGKGARCDRVIAAKGRSTITKTRFLAGAKLTSRQQVLRLDRQPVLPPDPKLLAQIAQQVRQLDAGIDAWIVSDYGYGSFDGALCTLFREIAQKKTVVADSRFRLTEFKGLTVVKPNEEEAQAAANELGIKTNNPTDLAACLPGALDAKAALVTLGNQGMLLGRSQGVLHIPAVGTEEIVDLTGAGDSVAAALTAALAVGADLEIAARLSNHAGAIVVMKEGAATASPDELRESVRGRENV